MPAGGAAALLVESAWSGPTYQILTQPSALLYPFLLPHNLSLSCQEWKMKQLKTESKPYSVSSYSVSSSYLSYYVFSYFVESYGRFNLLTELWRYHSDIFSYEVHDNQSCNYSFEGSVSLLQLFQSFIFDIWFWQWGYSWCGFFIVIILGTFWVSWGFPTTMQSIYQAFPLCLSLK